MADDVTSILPSTLPGIGRPSVHDLLELEVVEATAEKVVLRIPVTWRTHQPFGVLHGGVSALVAESAASIGGYLASPPGKTVVGVDLNASHLRGLSEGTLTATATPLRIGRTLQVWTIALTDDADRAICSARCTLAVVDLPI
jgi:1,4-dihydroxy-2-naphthoyl-CoA hydrolase